MKINKIYVTRNPGSRDSEIFDYAFKTYIGDTRKGTDHIVYYILGSINPESAYRHQWFEEEHRVYTTKEDAVDDACERYRIVNGLKRCPDGIRTALDYRLSDKAF